MTTPLNISSMFPSQEQLTSEERAQFRVKLVKRDGGVVCHGGGVDKRSR